MSCIVLNHSYNNKHKNKVIHEKQIMDCGFQFFSHWQTWYKTCVCYLKKATDDLKPIWTAFEFGRDETIIKIITAQGNNGIL
jgi:hypothetical protein